jgi:hypothetical protein
MAPHLLLLVAGSPRRHGSPGAAAVSPGFPARRPRTLRPVRAAWLLPLALLACSRGADVPPTASGTPSPTASPTAAPSPTAWVFFAGEPVHFTTPSRNMGCHLTAEAVICDIAKYTGPLPPRPAGCEFDWVAGATIDANGVTIGRCTSDTALGATRVLAYGTSVQVGDIRCTSAREGLICRDGGGTSGGFMLSRTALGTFDY